MLRRWTRFPREAVDVSWPEVFKVRSDGFLSNLILWKRTLAMEWGLGCMISIGSCQPKSFYESVNFLCFPSRPNCIQFWVIFFESHKKRHNDPRQLLWSKRKLLLQGSSGISHKMDYIHSLLPRVFKRAQHFLLKCPNYRTQGFPFGFCFPSLSSSFCYFQITYQSFLNTETQSKPQALVLSNQHFDKISGSLSALFICLRLL